MNSDDKQLSSSTDQCAKSFIELANNIIAMHKFIEGENNPVLMAMIGKTMSALSRYMEDRKAFSERMCKHLSNVNHIMHFVDFDLYATKKENVELKQKLDGQDN